MGEKEDARDAVVVREGWASVVDRSLQHSAHHAFELAGET